MVIAKKVLASANRITNNNLMLAKLYVIFRKKTTKYEMWDSCLHNANLEKSAIVSNSSLKNSAELHVADSVLLA